MGHHTWIAAFGGVRRVDRSTDRHGGPDTKSVYRPRAANRPGRGASGIAEPGAG